MVAGILASIAGSVLTGLASKAFEAAKAEPAPPPTLDKDDFLRLLTVQLRNQDPLNPMASTDFLAQTAQFTSLEQLQNMNRSLQQLLAQGGGAGVANGAALLGRSVLVNGSPVTLGPTGGAALAYTLPAAASGVAIQIQDAAGTPVRTLLFGAQEAGTHQLAFDGLDDAGRRLAAGPYRYQVRGIDGSGGLLSGVTTGRGQVTGFNVEDGQLVLLLGPERVPLTSVVSVVASAP